MKVLITGATGLLGRRLTTVLLSQNIQVHYLSTRKEKLETAPNYKGFYWNPKEGEIDCACLDGIDAIIHLAGASIAAPWTAKNKKAILSSRIDTAALLLARLQEKKQRITSFISASAIGIYPSSYTATYKEETPIEIEKDNFLQSVVVAWEKAAQDFSAVAAHVACIRIGLVLSTQGGLLGSLLPLVKMGVASPIGSGAQWQSWIHTEDLVQIFVQALKAQWEGVYNAVAPNPCTQKVLLQQLGKQLHRPIWLPPVPPLALKVFLGERSALALSSQLVQPKAVAEKQFKFQFPQLEKALEQVLKK